MIELSDLFLIFSDQALRIKTKASATDASVSDVTYSGNTATGMRQFGVLIDQSYPDTLGTPGNGVKVSVRLSPSDSFSTPPLNYCDVCNT